MIEDDQQQRLEGIKSDRKSTKSRHRERLVQIERDYQNETVQASEKCEENLKELAQEKAKGFGVGVEELVNLYKKQNNEDLLKYEMRERKLFNILIAENVVKTGPKEEFLAFINKREGGDGV
jgi:FKBP-type peptidyl-prolyl cis-trans isomerase (trigger factor)